MKICWNRINVNFFFSLYLAICLVPNDKSLNFEIMEFLFQIIKLHENFISIDKFHLIMTLDPGFFTQK